MYELPEGFTEYALSDQEFMKLVHAMSNPGLLGANNVPIRNAQERCDAVWKEVAKERGLDWETILPSPSMDPKYFIAKKETNDGKRSDGGNCSTGGVH